MVPRCFLYSSPQPLPSGRRNRKHLPSVLPSLLQSRERMEEEDVVKSIAPSVSTVLSGAPSRPMAIPTRSHPKALRRHHGRTAFTQCCSNPVEMIGRKHDPEALPPAVAALLAVTSIPPPIKPGSLGRHWQTDRRSQKQIAAYGSHVDELCARDSERMTGYTLSSLDLLLRPPDELEGGIASTSTSEETARSLSSESIPSLENDDESTASSSAPSTPGRGSRKIGVEKRPRALSSPRAQDCALDHPLLSPISEPDTLWNGEFTGRPDVSKPRLATSPVPPRSLFKSNLTASLRVLKSAARSFSNFTAPVVQQDGNLTRSTLAIQPHTTDDRRPIPSFEPPDPVLRRYLNPICASPAELHMASGYFVDSGSDIPCTFSIQLQTYRPSTAISKKATSPPVFLSPDLNVREPGTPPPEARQREPRENSDFLRIVVMEMNMRRKGKLADDAKGKARLWLPPRPPCPRQSRLDSEVPNRWISVAPGQ